MSIQLGLILWNHVKIYMKSELNPYSAGIDFRRQNPISTDVRFWRLKSIAALKE